MMRAVLLAAVAMLLSGCGEAPKPASSNDSAPPTANASRPAVVEKPAPTIDLPAGEPANRPARGTTIADVANRPRRVDTDPNATPPPLDFRPAAENSKVAVWMGADGVVREVRIFDGNPNIAKVELALLANGEKDLKFTMKDGKIVERRTDKIKDLATAKTSDLVAIAGQ